MARARSHRGSVVQGEHPNWQPLLNLVGEEGAGDFMWMFEVELEDGRRVQAYKHIDTRRYIHAGADGAVYLYESPERYRVAPAVDVVRAALWRRAC
jgi:hypothetical protein